MFEAEKDSTTSNAASPSIPSDPDCYVINLCQQADALLEIVERYYRGEGIGSDDEMADIQTSAWRMTHEAMRCSVSTLAGLRAQIALLIRHHRCQTSGPDHPDIELPPLHNALRLLSAVI